MNMKKMSKRIFVSKSCILFFIYFFIFSILSYCIFLSQLKKALIPRLYTRCRRGKKHFDVLLRRIRTVHFLSKDGKGASYDGRDGWKIVFFPPESAYSDFDVILLDSTFPYLYLDLPCKRLRFPPGKIINRRHESNHYFSRRKRQLETRENWQH